MRGDVAPKPGLTRDGRQPANERRRHLLLDDRLDSGKPGLHLRISRSGGWRLQGSADRGGGDRRGHLPSRASRNRCSHGRCNMR